MSHRDLWLQYNRLAVAARAAGSRRISPLRREWAISLVAALGRVERARDIARGWNVNVEEVQSSVVNDALFSRPVAGTTSARTRTRRRPISISAAQYVRAEPVIEDMNAPQTFGVEFEVFLPEGMTHAALATLITDAGVSCHAEFYNHSLRNHWKVVTDGSLGDYARGAEIVSPILSGEEGFGAMRKVCEVMLTAGCKIKRNCGFHVHVGARRHSRNVTFFKNLLKLYRRHEAVIDSFLAPSRRGTANVYCRTMQTFSMERLDTTNHVSDLQTLLGTRYMKLNLESFWRHGTVEFRQHQGTVEARKAEMWVRLCLRMVEAAASGVMSWHPEVPFLQAINASEDEANYVIERITAFADREARVADRMRRAA